MKKTKIIATIGPSSSSSEVLEQMIKEGVDVIRINLSHASFEFCDDIIAKVREIETKLNKPVGIMLDTTGPSVRLDKLIEDKTTLVLNSELKIFNYHVICNNTQLSFNNPEVVDDLDINDVLLLSDGSVELEVVDKENDYVVCKVIKGGEIYSRQSVHLKEKTFNLPFLNEEDLKGIKYGIENNVDFIALSYVRDEQDVLEIVDLLIESDNNHCEIIAKIENARALENIDEIAKVSDGLMVARGDLGLEMLIEKLPLYQKTILNKAHEYKKVGIVATDLLMSMSSNNYPSRAEVSDIYNAVLSKCDAVLLSGETTVGNYPVETIKTMSKIIESTEEDFDYLDNLEETIRNTEQNITSSIAYSVVDSSLRLNARCVIANTNSGYTAKLISHFHPKCPILGLSPSLNSVRSLTIVYGVIPMLVEECKTTDSIVKMCMKEATKKLQLEEDNVVIITGGFPISNKNTNFMKIEVINNE